MEKKSNENDFDIREYSVIKNFLYCVKNTIIHYPILFLWYVLLILINIRQYKEKGKSLDVDTILECIQQAKRLNFNGYVAFHNYNEPLMSKDQMIEVIQRSPDTKYLLWTNGLLLDSDMTKNMRRWLKSFPLFVFLAVKTNTYKSYKTVTNNFCLQFC